MDTARLARWQIRLWSRPGRPIQILCWLPDTLDIRQVTHFDDTFVLVLDRQTGREVTRIDVGAAQANASFPPDGATAFVTVTGAENVAMLDMRQLTVVAAYRQAVCHRCCAVAKLCL